jgi:thiamine transport system permease protein
VIRCKANSLFYLGLCLAVFVLIAGLFFPFTTLLIAAQKQMGILAWLKLFFSSEILSTVALTLGYSISALLAAFLLSLPLALFLQSNRECTYRARFEEFLQILWVLPAFLYALLIIECFRRFRNIDPMFELYSMRTVWVAWVAVAIPFLTISFLRALRDLDPRELDMVRVLGANRKNQFLCYEYPKLSPMVRSALLHQMWLYLTSFTLVVILGGGPPYETLEVGVYTSVRMDQLNYARALALSAWQLAILITLRLMLNRSRHSHFEAKVGVEWIEHSIAQTKSLRSGLRKKQIWAATALVSFCVYSFSKNSDLAEVFITGVTLSGLVAVFSLVYTMAVFFLRQRWLAEWGAWISPMVLSLAWWKAYAFSAPSLLLCVLIQVILLSPWIARVFYPVLERTRTAEVEAVRTLGASPIRAWIEVEWPRVRRQAQWMMALVFGLSLSEVSTVILFSRGDFEPLSVWIQNQMSRFQFASAFEGTLLLLAVSVSALMLTRAKDA